MSKYRSYFRQMLKENEALFTRFMQVHQAYEKDPKQAQTEFNQVGSEVMDIVGQWEKQLCASTERGQYSKYSAGLSEKFRAELRTFFPKIDFVGVEIE